MIVQLVSSVTLGGPVGIGFLALIYKPVITYYKTFGIGKGIYVYYSGDNIVVRDEDIYYNHDLTLVYSLRHLGFSVGINSPIKYIESYGKIWRIGIFAVGS